MVILCLTHQLLQFKENFPNETLHCLSWALPYVFLQLPFMHKDSTYRINVHTFNKTLEFPERIKKIDVSIYGVRVCKWIKAIETYLGYMPLQMPVCMCKMSCSVFSHQAMEYLPFEGTVNLKSPQHIFCLLEDYGTDPNNIPEHPYYIYFGRWVRCIWVFAYIWPIKADLQLISFHIFYTLTPDSRWTAWTDSLLQCEEQTLHRKHQYGCRALIHHGQPCQGQREWPCLWPVRWHRWDGPVTDSHTHAKQMTASHLGQSVLMVSLFLSLDVFQAACWSHVLILEPMSVEQILITTLFMAKVSFVFLELTLHIIYSLLYV